MKDWRRIALASIAVNVAMAAVTAVVTTDKAGNTPTSNMLPDSPASGTGTSPSSADDQRCRVAESTEYWKPKGLRDAQTMVRGYECMESMRSEVLKAFGSRAIQESEFASIFRPYQSDFPFLEAEKQLALQRIKADHARRIMSMGNLGPATAAAVSESTQIMNKEVRALLSEQEFFEYSLRESIEAQRLLATGFDFSESEFRELFRLGKLTPSGTPSRTFIAPADASVTSGEVTIGGERWAEFQRTRDPIYRVLWLAAPRHGLRKKEIDAAYGLIGESIRQIEAQRPIGSPSISNIEVHRDRELRSVLGDAAFEEVSRQIKPFLPGTERRVVTNVRQ